MPERFPLDWPHWQERAPAYKRGRARFQQTPGAATDGLLYQVKGLGGTGLIISSDVPVTKDGRPYANARQPDDPGVAVYFDTKGGAMVFACDRWDRLHDNVWAIAKTIEAIRGIDRWGTGQMRATALKGFAALPPPPSTPHWSDILQVPRTASLETINAGYRQLAKHAADLPADALVALNLAVEAARKERAGT